MVALLLPAIRSNEYYAQAVRELEALENETNYFQPLQDALEHLYSNNQADYELDYFQPSIANRLTGIACLSVCLCSVQIDWLHTAKFSWAI